MKCPSCGRLYKRVMFEVDEVYFECKKCEVELTLSPAESLSELPRLQERRAREQSTAASPSSNSAPVTVAHEASMVPLLLWVVLLLGLTGIVPINAVRDVADGVVAPGVLVLLLAWLLLIPTAITAFLRRRVGLYLTFALLGTTLFVSSSRFINPSGESDAERGGNMVWAMAIGAVALAWLLWFLRNVHMFGQPAPVRGSTPSDDRPAT